MTRDERLEMAKQRARRYLEKGDLLQAVTSIGMDMEKIDGKRPDDSAMHGINYYGIMAASQGDIMGVRSYIEGFR